MPKIEELVLAGRYRAVLRAAAAGRCRIGVGYAPVLWVDEMVCADSSAGHRLLAAGLIHPAADRRRSGRAARVTRPGVGGGTRLDLPTRPF